MPTKATSKKKPTMKKAAAHKPVAHAKKKVAKLVAAKKVTAVKKPMMMTPKKPKTPSQRGFMWRLLEEKRAAQKHKAEVAAEGKSSAFERFRPQNSNGFSRFNGPRRKAG